MRQEPLYELPMSSCDTYRDVFFYSYCILYDYDREDGKKIRTGIRFKLITAYRSTNAECTVSWQYENLDTLVEIYDSPWLEEFRAILAQANRDWVVRHFKLFTHGNCFEFLATSWELLPEYEGIWDDVLPDRKLFAGREVPL